MSCQDSMLLCTGYVVSTDKTWPLAASRFLCIIYILKYVYILHCLNISMFTYVIYCVMYVYMISYIASL